MDEVYDIELYEWTKIDLSDVAQKERVKAMIEDQEPLEGDTLLDAKCFECGFVWRRQNCLGFHLWSLWKSSMLLVSLLTQYTMNLC